MTRPMLGDLDLEQVQMLETDEDQMVTYHPVPSLDGGFVQPMGRRAARFRLTGVLTAEPTRESLAQLRRKFMEAQPVSFVSDISSATLVDEVLIENMDVRELAGAPERIEYRFVLREYREPKPIEPSTVDVPPTDIPEVEHGALSVTVVVEGDPAFDLDRVQISVSGTPDVGPPTGRRQLTNKISDDVWFEPDFPAGQFRVDALVDDNRNPNGEREVLTASADTRVENGEVASVTLVLRRGSKIGTVFKIHFRFDSAFIEPCMRPVLRQVAKFADDHGDRQLLIVGHTDLVGSPAYNQSLSERRSRAAYAFMTFGVNRKAAIEEWNELRRIRPVGVLPSSRDSWGIEQYQHMLQDLGFYQGNIGGDLDLTDAAVRRFQAQNGLDPDGDVGDLTWPVLIEQYLAQDNLAIAPGRFLPNADGKGCDAGPLRWLGCNEQDPVLVTQDAWRPNRRTELMFVTEPKLPCPVPKPDTLDMVSAGAGGGGWCLGGPGAKLCCFVTPATKACSAQETEKWCRQPAEPGTILVSGRLQFSDGTPLAKQKYVLTAPDGEYLFTDSDGKPAVGEVKKTDGPVRAGTPIAGRTDTDGRFSYPLKKGIGIYTLEVQGPFVVFRLDDRLTNAKGNIVCARLDGSSELVVVVVDRAVAAVSPTLTGPDAVLVRKPHTNPARRLITMGASGPFTGTGTLTRSSDAVRVFDAPAGGTEIRFDGTGNVFTSAQLASGLQLFAQGERASTVVGDVGFTLTLTVNGTPGLTETIQMTSVELTLDIAALPDATGADRGNLSATDKANPGRFLQAQTPDRQASRARIVVQPIQPAGFTGTLTLRRLNNRVDLFAAAVPAPADVALGPEQTIPAPSIPATGRQFFAQGTSISAAPADTGFQLGIDGIDADGDRVAVTVAVIEMIRADNTAFPLVGNDACHMVSKFVTNQNLPDIATFDGPPGAAPDPDTFRIQVRGLPPGTVPVGRLVITRPGTAVYNRDFPMLAGVVAGVTTFRSNEHVRLVSNATDDAHLAHQTPLVRLADNVSATVLIGGGSLGGIALPVGRPPAETGPKAIRTADIHFVTLTGLASNPAATVNRMSENWAQLAIRFNLLNPSETVTAVANALSVDFALPGATAAANGTLSIDITPAGGATTTVVAAVAAGDNDQTIAAKLAAAISARPGLSATHHAHDNQFLVIVNRRTAVAFANPATTVAGLLFTVPPLNFSDGITLLEGSVLGLNFSDGDPTTIDIIVVSNNPIINPTTLGATGGDFLLANLPGWHNLAIIRQSAADGTVGFTLVAGHEMGHALMDGGNNIHARAVFQLATSPVATNLFQPFNTTDAIGAAKRLDNEQNTRARAVSGPTTAPPILHAR